jgi:hypothetical protein
MGTPSLSPPPPTRPRVYWAPPRSVHPQDRGSIGHPLAQSTATHKTTGLLGTPSLSPPTRPRVYWAPPRSVHPQDRGSIGHPPPSPTTTHKTTQYEERTRCIYSIYLVHSISLIWFDFFNFFIWFVDLIGFFIYLIWFDLIWFDSIAWWAAERHYCRSRLSA